MLLVGALLAYTMLTVFAAPLVLTVGRWRIRYPRLALLLWHGAFLSGLAAAAASILVSLIVAVSLSNAGHTPGVTWWETSVPVLAGWMALGVAGAAGALLFAKSESVIDADRETYYELNSLVSLRGYRSEQRGEMTVTYLDSDRAFACAVPGVDRTVIVSSRLVSALSRPELDAVIEHERTHLRHHHGLALRLADVNVSCLPALPGAREMRRATALLIELIADDVAATRCGHAHLISALATIATIEEDEAMLLRARRLEHRMELRGQRRTVRRVARAWMRV